MKLTFESVTWGHCLGYCYLSPSTSVMPHPHRFLGNSALWWDLRNDMTISTPWYLGLVFRTRSREGTLLQAQAGQYTSLLFQVFTHKHTRCDTGNRFSSWLYSLMYLILEIKVTFPMFVLFICAIKNCNIISHSCTTIICEICTMYILNQHEDTYCCGAYYFFSLLICGQMPFFIIWFILTVFLKIQSKAITGNVLEVVFTEISNAKSKDSRKFGILAEYIGYRIFTLSTYARTHSCRRTHSSLFSYSFGDSCF